MHKRFRKTADQTIIGDCSSSSSEDASGNHQRIRSLVRRKYVRQKRTKTDELDISDTSSEEEPNSQDPGQENRKWAANLKRYSSDHKPQPLTPQNKFQPLSLFVSVKAPSPTLATNSFDMANCSTSIASDAPATCRAAWHSFRQTLAALKRDRQGQLQASNSKQETMNETLLECTLNTSIEANLETMIDTQQTPNSCRRVAKQKQRCIKGGHLYEFKRLILRERMDRRSLAHNQRLGISSGQRVRVLSISESFGCHMARVQDEAEDKGIFNIILSPSMSPCVGATLELYFELKPETALQLANKELVYVQPNKLVLL
ncbi:uncharacterized protein [Drosophila virilis]|uniref:Uncharacterized protein n=1 Tax=Drosophila virilis TaxID=7244 RepID=B4LCY6_DROVI|nr:uncharacterized protein LOC6622963 [Drosophila virilis]EDW68847.1 uncharacterized protein Dvir_GJ12455 [Drosophila virilis]